MKIHVEIGQKLHNILIVLILAVALFSGKGDKTDLFSRVYLQWFAGTTYYVSTIGSNTYNGLYETHQGGVDGPWLTPQKAADSATTAGDIVNFLDGTYTVTSNVRFAVFGTAANPITYKSLNEHGARIHQSLSGPSDATIMVGVWGGDNWTPGQEMHLVFEGLRITGGLVHGFQTSGGGYVTVDNCKIYDTGYDCIKINHEADYVTIKNCEIYNSGQNDESPEGDGNSEGIDITSSDYVTIQDNHIHDIFSWGVYCKKGSEFTMIERNLIHDIHESGIGLGESQVAYDAIARNNIIWNVDHTGIQFSGAYDCKAYNNTIYKCGLDGINTWSGIRVTNANEIEGLKGGDTSLKCRNVYLKNNIVIVDNALGNLFRVTTSGLQGATEGEMVAQLNCDYNLYYNIGSSVDDLFAWRGSDYDGLSAWQSATSTLGKEQETNSYLEDPKFVSTNEENESFIMLQSNSPGVDNGVTLASDVPTDYLENDRPQGSAYDIGAYERLLAVIFHHGTVLRF